MFESSRFLPIGRYCKTPVHGLDGLRQHNLERRAARGKAPTKVSYSDMVVAADKLALADQQLVQEVPDADYS